jgi:hypothetical protein
LYPYYTANTAVAAVVLDVPARSLDKKKIAGETLKLEDVKKENEKNK